VEPIDETLDAQRGLSRRMLLGRTAVAGAGLSGLAAFAAACGTDEGSAGQSGDAGRDLTFAYPQSGGAERFLRVVRNGAEQAGADLGVTVKVTSTKKFDQAEQGRLVRAAAASKPDGIITGVWDGDVMKGPVSDATSAGIPVVIMNSGLEFVEPFGALTFVGPDVFADAVTVGERMKDEGAKRVLAVNHQVGSAPLDLRLDGFEKGFGGEMRTIGVNGADPVDSRNRIRAALEESGFDGVIALGQPSGEPALQALEDTGKAKQVTFGSFDFSVPLLDGVKAGDVSFVVDQQQYLQGYYSVVVLALFARYGFQPPKDVAQVGGFVTRENAADVLAQTRELVR
jgi:simple sugar transport system substrate-binding protein